MEEETLRDQFAAMALGNGTICTGFAKDHDLARWFGGRGGVTKPEICSAQAYEYADAMMNRRKTRS